MTYGTLTKEFDLRPTTRRMITPTIPTQKTNVISVCVCVCVVCSSVGLPDWSIFLSCFFRHGCIALWPVPSAALLRPRTGIQKMGITWRHLEKTVMQYVKMTPSSLEFNKKLMTDPRL